MCPLFLLCHQVIKNDLNPSWPSFEISSNKLCNSDPRRTIRVREVRRGWEGVWGERQDWWMFACFWVWVERERVERKGVGKKGKGVGLGARCMVPWSRQTLDGVLFTGGKNGRENSKGMKREAGQSTGLPDAALRLAWGGCSGLLSRRWGSSGWGESTEVGEWVSCVSG